MPHYLHTWKGATAVFAGDSITYGTGTDKPYWSFVQDQAEFHRLTAMGVGGSCASLLSDYRYERPPLIIRHRFVPKADLILLFIGTNDWGHETPFGTPEDRGDISFHGALDTILGNLREKYPEALIAMMTPLHRYGFGHSKLTGEHYTYDYLPNGRGAGLCSYAAAIRTVCARHGVPVIELHRSQILDPSDPAQKEAYTADGVHPNREGCKIVAREILRFLDSTPCPSHPDHSGERSGIFRNSLQLGSKFDWDCPDDPHMASGSSNLKLKAGQTVTLTAPDMTWFITRSPGPNSASPSDGDRRPPFHGPDMVFTVPEDGNYGIVLKKNTGTFAFPDGPDPLDLMDYIRVE